MEMLYDDTYTGPRWTYGLDHRPAHFSSLPKNWIVWSAREHPDFRFGTIDYPAPLTPDEVEQYELKLTATANNSSV